MARELEELIRRADQADREAVDKLFTVLYGELHRLAERISDAREDCPHSRRRRCCTKRISTWPAARVWHLPTSRISSRTPPAPCGLIIDYARNARTARYRESGLTRRGSGRANARRIFLAAGRQRESALVESRLYAGIHCRFDKDAALGIARQVAALALRRGVGTSKHDDSVRR